MAFGDSITAGFSIDSGILENRGLSWAIGGDNGATTLPNFLRVYNPTLSGASVQSHLPEMHGTAHQPELDHLNAAQSGGVVNDLPAQAQYLAEQLAALPSATAGWKLLTVWIGSNNLCGSCKNNTSDDPDNYEQQLNQTLTVLRQNVSNLLVNLVRPLAISSLRSLEVNDTWCELLHKVAAECYCAFYGTPEQLQQMDQYAHEYGDRLDKLAAQWNAYGYSDFGVTVQPFLTDSAIPDPSYLSKLDCFHPSELAHSKLAINTWNSLLTPVPLKEYNWAVDTTPVCATDDSRLFTALTPHRP